MLLYRAVEPLFLYSTMHMISGSPKVGMMISTFNAIVSTIGHGLLCASIFIGRTKYIPLYPNWAPPPYTAPNSEQTNQL